MLSLVWVKCFLFSKAEKESRLRVSLGISNWKSLRNEQVIWPQQNRPANCYVLQALHWRKNLFLGFKYNGPHGDTSSSTDLFSEGKVWIIVTVCASVMAFIAMICSPCCWKFFRKRKDVLCYLCHAKISAHLWQEGNHRQDCAEKHKQFLDNLPCPCDINCPQCGLKLRLWPVQDHAKFKCHSKECVHHKAGHELDNDGSNRFNCFLHDYNVCGECVMKKITSNREPVVKVDLEQS